MVSFLLNLAYISRYETPKECIHINWRNCNQRFPIIICSNSPGSRATITGLLPRLYDLTLDKRTQIPSSFSTSAMALYSWSSNELKHRPNLASRGSSIRPISDVIFRGTTFETQASLKSLVGTNNY